MTDKYGKIKQAIYKSEEIQWTLHQLWQDLIKANKPKPN